jgi:hypothetical protein
MSHSHSQWAVRTAILLSVTCFLAAPAQAGFSVDEPPRETLADPGDVFFPGPSCDMDDGDGTCPPPAFNVPNPGDDQDPTFDLDALTIDDSLEVCPSMPQYPPGILFSLDDGDPGPGLGPPDHATEIYFYDHCNFLAATTQSYHTFITEGLLGLLNDPPPIEHDDDVDAYDTRSMGVAYDSGSTILFSTDTPSTGGLGTTYPEAEIWAVSVANPAPTVWAWAAVDIGVPDPQNCDLDGMARIFERDTTYLLLFTTDLERDCGLDPGDIWVTNLTGQIWLYADDVNDMKIAVNEEQPVDIDALAVNTPGELEILEPYEPPQFEGTQYKADWPNYAPSGMPDFSQDHVQWPPTWCGPTALADSLWWFDSEMACDSDRTSGQNAESEPNNSCDLADNLGEVPMLTGGFIGLGDTDWYVFEIPDKPYRTCRVTVSTCARSVPGDDDTYLSLYDGCSNTGVPGHLLATNDNGCTNVSALQSEIRIDLAAGSRYWVEVRQGPFTAGPGPYHLSLGIDCYPMVERDPDVSDDHSEYNPRPLIEDLAWCMNTDDLQGTGSGHTGTQLVDMHICVDAWLVGKGLRDAYTDVVALMPPFDEVAWEIERSEDVLLLLGFWWQNQAGGWERCGGHFVTSAGVDLAGETITLSDPGINNAETGAPGRVRGPDHGDHAPAINPPPDHDDTQNISHDRYRVGLPNVPSHALWSLPTYATNGVPTNCADVARWCMPGESWGQNPPEIPAEQAPCPDPLFPVSTEVEAMVDVSPKQTPVCVFLDGSFPWPNNLRMRKTPCTPTVEVPEKDVIRGKLCNLKFIPAAPVVDLGWVQCLYDDSSLTEFEDLSPDDTQCMGSWFYLIRQSGDLDYGSASPGGEVRIPSGGGCP